MFRLSLARPHPDFLSPEVRQAQLSIVPSNAPWLQPVDQSLVDQSLVGPSLADQSLAKISLPTRADTDPSEHHSFTQIKFGLAKTLADQVADQASDRPSLVLSFA